MEGAKTSLIKCNKVYCNVFIIACHFFQYYGNELCYWLNAGVQLFFIISGFLYGKKQIEDPISFLVKGFKKVLVPYELFLLIALIFYFLFWRNDLTLMSVAKAVFLCWYNQRSRTSLVCWLYIAMLYIDTIPFLDKAKVRG